MPAFPIVEVAIAFFIGMGPVKIVAPYLAATHGAPLVLRRRVALLTVAAATLTALVLLLTGVILLRLLHLGDAALLIGGAIVMLAVGLQTVLAPEHGGEPPAPVEADLLRQAIHPLAVPILLNPAGIAAAILLSAEVYAVGGLAIAVGIILGIAAIDLAVLLGLAHGAHRLRLEAIVIIERVFGVLLVAMAVQLVLYALTQLGVVAPTPH